MSLHDLWQKLCRRAARWWREILLWTGLLALLGAQLWRRGRRRRLFTELRRLSLRPQKGVPLLALGLGESVDEENGSGLVVLPLSPPVLPAPDWHDLLDLFVVQLDYDRVPADLARQLFADAGRIVEWLDGANERGVRDRAMVVLPLTNASLADLEKALSQNRTGRHLRPPTAREFLHCLFQYRTHLPPKPLEAVAKLGRDWQKRVGGLRSTTYVAETDATKLAFLFPNPLPSRPDVVYWLGEHFFLAVVDD